MSDDEPDVAAEWTCAICQDVLLAPVVTPCGHAFDERCLLSWTKDHGTCPVCRSEIPRAGYAVCGALRAAVERCAGDAVSRRRAFRAGAEDFVTLARSTAPETPRKLRAEALRTPRLVAERRESDGATALIAAARAGAADNVAQLLRLGAAVGARDGAGRDALASAGSAAVVAVLYDRYDDAARRAAVAAVVARVARRHDLAVEALAALLERGAPIPTTAFASRAVLLDVDLTAAFLARLAWRGDGAEGAGFYDAREPGRRHGDAVLVTAVQEGASAEVVRALLDAGADPRGRDDEGVPPLFAAATSGCERKLRAILDAAAPLSSDDVNGLHWNQDTERVESALAAAVAADDVPGEAPTVELLLQSGLCDLDVEDDDGDTPLLRAAALKRVGAVEALLAAQRFANLDKASSGDGSTPLIRALLPRDGDSDDDGDDDAAEAIVKALLEAGADPNLHRSSDLAYPTVLAVAHRADAPAILEALLEHGARPDAPSGHLLADNPERGRGFLFGERSQSDPYAGKDRYYQPLELAVRHEKWSSAAALLRAQHRERAARAESAAEEGHRFFYEARDALDTALELASSTSVTLAFAQQIVEFCLEHEPAALELPRPFRRWYSRESALHAAAAAGAAQICGLLLRADDGRWREARDTISASRDVPATPLMLAIIDESRLSAAELAAARGFGDVVETMVARAPEARAAALVVAAARGQAAVVAKLDVGTRAGWDRPLSPQDAGAWHDPLAAAAPDRRAATWYDPRRLDGPTRLLVAAVVGGDVAVLRTLLDAGLRAGPVRPPPERAGPSAVVEAPPPKRRRAAAAAAELASPGPGPRLAMLATLLGHHDCLRELLARDWCATGVAPDAPRRPDGAPGFGPLHAAALLDDARAADALLSAEGARAAEACDARDAKGLTPLHYAAIGGFEFVADECGGADSLRPLECYDQVFAWTALPGDDDECDVANYGSVAPRREDGASSLPVLRRILDAGASPALVVSPVNGGRKWDDTSMLGLTPLELAVYGRRAALVEPLLAAAASATRRRARPPAALTRAVRAVRRERGGGDESGATGALELIRAQLASSTALTLEPLRSLTYRNSLGSWKGE
ncbi:hypothetical protein AURANDRAFT_64494 [Aureococcus anophagefferens]|uniref:RING-type domain-containing protein n=1 Tax=Aureococcus anophagefferens TaxID=44056 RepID=F0YAC4_AURAN|nr:hypothetical protein AURANDRAFT_64494 [Aureococcus anophagefferens]EGB08025.1 hypothetical protein AURANDRAFT_64494 [Aureococcus anophagefferens]|eukprot:XP_009037387.1 hypothetical protein AURANDRAFT_64494 [Aureococcus anophagefferens]